MAKYYVCYSIEGSIEFEAETPQQAQRQFNKLNAGELGEMGLLIQHTDPPIRADIKFVAERSVSDERAVSEVDRP